MRHFLILSLLYGTCIAATVRKSNETFFADFNDADISKDNMDLKRVRRGKDPTYTIGLYVFFDEETVRILEGEKHLLKTREDIDKFLRQFYGMMIHSMNVIFESMKGIRMHIQAAGHSVVQIPEIDSLPHKKVPGTERRTSCNTQTLAAFNRYVKTHRSSLPKHNHVMLITGYQLYDGTYYIDGWARALAICTEESTSVGRFYLNHAPFISISAHELGHGIGAVDHDGEDLAKSCKASAGNIMQPSAMPLSKYRNKLEFFKFSQCSVNAIKAYMAHLSLGGRNCLLHPYKKVPLDGEYYGSEISLDNQCHLLAGEDYKFLKTKTNICLTFSCQAPGKPSRNILPYPGTPCGTKKGCVNGKCVKIR